eukprot:7774107-Pyramimonas_sp.AAC.1
MPPPSPSISSKDPLLKKVSVAENLGGIRKQVGDANTFLALAKLSNLQPLLVSISTLCRKLARISRVKADEDVHAQRSASKPKPK